MDQYRRSEWYLLHPRLPDKNKSYSLAAKKHYKSLIFRFYLYYATERLCHTTNSKAINVLIDTIMFQQSVEKIHQIISYLRQSRTREPQKPLIRKIGTVYPRPKCSGATFGVLRLMLYSQRTLLHYLIVTFNRHTIFNQSNNKFIKQTRVLHALKGS